MKIKNAQLINAVPALSKLMHQDHKIKVSLKIRKIVQALDILLKPINDERQKLVEKGTMLDGEGNKMFADKEQQYVRLTPAGVMSLNELSNLETEVEVEQLAVEDIKDSVLTAAEVESISWLLKE